jgi:hypothetical protein
LALYHYLPAEGWVFFQVDVDGKENEITAAPRVLKCLDFVLSANILNSSLSAD